MFITLVAVLCHTLAGMPEPVCVEEIVTDSAMDGRLTWVSCQIDAQAGIAAWLSDNPEYRNWTLARWKCVPGHYAIGKRA